ncbi:hypothetical protein LM602_06440 [Candidatus Acetothermia bacterium]|jgi:Tol biopolymer transport system component|nr:hypothetical protein [Candidatus Acetothermia bacterium]MCI2432173.1 hypothetical protein [Candidatus Acetothermia bacterium]MCI2436134.1 hypothetical protein [Candidatus Acetothermia bacterium]
MHRVFYVLFVLLISLIFQSRPAGAQFLELDPVLNWSLLETEHFNIIYPEGLEEIAQEAALISEEAYRFWVRELRYAVPVKMNVILADPADFAVGAAHPFGDLIAGISHARTTNEWLNPQNPSWLENLLYHEIGHVFDLTKVHGISQLVRPYLGPLVLPNASKPGIIIEGIPIYFELKRSGASRSNSSRVAMYFRAQVLENRFIPLDQMSTSYDRKQWPSEYMLSHDGGAWFARFIAERYGDEKFARLNEINADSPLTVFSLGLLNNFGATFQKALGLSPQELERAWQEWLKAQFVPQIEKIKSAGVTSSKKIGRLAYWHNDPVWSPDGKFIYFYHKDSRREASLRRVTREGKEDSSVVPLSFELSFFRPPFFASAPQISPDGKSVLYARHEIFALRYTYSDLYLWDLEKKEEKVLTEQARAYAPVFFPDGQRVLFAQQRADGQSPALAIYEINGGRIVPFYEFTDDLFIDSFAISPDGKQIALSLWKMGGYQDLYLLDVESKILTAITQDKFGDFDPDWSPNGDFVLFSSDREEGVYNLYAYRISDGQLLKVTNVLTGAFAPTISPNGKEIAFIGYSTQGYELHLIEADPAQWKPATLTQEIVKAWTGWRNANIVPKRYRAQDFLAPRIWLPIPNPRQPGLFFVGFDPLGQKNYSLYTALDLKTQQLVLSLNYVSDLTLKSEWGWLRWLTDGVNSLGPQVALRAERSAETIVGAELHLTLGRRLGQTQRFSLGAELRQTREDTISSLTLRYEERLQGRSDLLRIGKAMALQAKLSWVRDQLKTALLIQQREQLSLPVEFENRVTRTTILARDDLKPLRAGGPGGSWPVRGFAKDSYEATQIVYSGWEVELPLVSLERGLGLWSVFFDRFTGVFFLDAARLSQELLGEGEMLSSYGGELRLTVVFGYGLPIELRAGVAVADNKTSFYFDLGSWF